LSLQEAVGLLPADASVDRVLDSILSELERALPCDAAAVWLLHEGDLRLCAAHKRGAEVRMGDPAPDANPWLTLALDADRPLVRAPGSPPDPLGGALGFPADHSAISAPLLAGGRRLGVVTLAHHSPGRYGDEAGLILDTFASHAAVAIENVRRYRAAQEQAWILTAMLQVAEATQSLTSLDDVVQRVVRLAAMLVGAARCALLLWDESGAAFVPGAAHGLAPVQQAAFDRWRVRPGDVPDFDLRRRENAPLTPWPARAGWGPAAFGSEALVVPLPSTMKGSEAAFAHGETMGIMMLDGWSNRAGSGVAETSLGKRRAMAHGVAHQAAAAVESARLLEAQQEEAYVSAALLQVAQAVVSSRDLDDVLDTIVRIVPMLVGVARCVIFLWDDDESVFRPAQAYGLPPEVEAALMGRAVAPGDVPLLDAVRECDGEPVEGVLPWVFSTRPPARGEPEGGPRAAVAIPLSARGDVLGAMVVQETEVAPRSHERRLELFTGIARQAALAVQNARLQEQQVERQRLERELQLAREVQQTFMPDRAPDLPGWELAFAWRAARQVAGDFYDFFALPGGRLGLVIADVADKGMPAALFMALTRTLVRAAARPPSSSPLGGGIGEMSPAAALARVNDLLVPDAHQGMFVTAVYTVLSSDAGALTYANAGHNLPLLVRPGAGEPETLAKGGMALGVLEGVRYEEHVVSLGPGDSLILYTDGVTEAFSPEGSMYGQERLRAAIRAAEGRSAQAMLDAIDGSVRAFVGDAAPSDDRTLVVLRRLES